MCFIQKDNGRTDLLPFLNTSNQLSMEGFHLGTADDNINAGTDAFWILDCIMDSKRFGLEGTLMMLPFQPLAVAGGPSKRHAA